MTRRVPMSPDTSPTATSGCTPPSCIPVTNDSGDAVNSILIATLMLIALLWLVSNARRK